MAISCVLIIYLGTQHALQDNVANNFSSSGYLSSAASYLPSMPGSSQVTDAAKDAPGKAQEGAGMAG